MDQRINNDVPQTGQDSFAKSILNIEVSCFANYNTPAKPMEVNLLRWLQSGKYKNEVGKIRAIENKEERDRIKALLPAITPSGIFFYRSEKDLIKHSGLIQFDIDYKENRHLGNLSISVIFQMWLIAVYLCQEKDFGG